MPRRLGSRLLVEAVVIAAVAVILGVLDHTGAIDLSATQQIAAILGASALVVLAGWAAMRERVDARRQGDPNGARSLQSLPPVAAGVPAPIDVPLAVAPTDPEVDERGEPEPGPEAPSGPEREVPR